MKSLRLLDKLVAFVQELWTVNEVDNIKASENHHHYSVVQISVPTMVARLLESDNSYRVKFDELFGFPIAQPIWNTCVITLMICTLMTCLYAIGKLLCKLCSRQKRLKNLDELCENQEIRHNGDILITLNYWRSCLLLIILSSSFWWEYNRLYQIEISRRAALTLGGLPAACLPRSMTLWQVSQSWLTWQLSWEQDACERYHYAVMVDPLWEVTPLLVLSSLLTRCITKPLEVLSQSIGISFRLLFSEIPSPWQPIIMIIAMTTIFVAIMFTFQYKISVPFVFTLEPKAKTRSEDVKTNTCVGCLEVDSKSDNRITRGKVKPCRVDGYL